MSKIRMILISIVNQNSIIRRIAKHIMRGWWLVRYKVTDLLTVTEPKSLVFEVYQGRQYTCSPRAIYERMQKQEKYQDYEFLWVFRSPDEYRWLESNHNTKVIRFGSQEYYKAFANSKYWFVNSRTRRCMVPGTKHCYVQTWHGTPLKRLGCDIEVEGNNIVSAKEMKADYKNEGKRVSYFLSPSAFYSAKIVSAFQIEGRRRQERIIELGYPRNDSLFQTSRDEITCLKRTMGLPLDRKVILYAPTFRDDQHSRGGCSFTMGFELSNFRQELGEEYILLFRTHYFVTQQIDLKNWKGFVFDMTGWEEINELYKVSDLLITDYSSVFFDYANLKRPILFFMYDLETYQKNIRDFYLDIDQLPGSVISDEAALYEEIRRINYDCVYDGRYQKFHDRYNYLDGPDTAQSVLDYLGV